MASVLDLPLDQFHGYLAESAQYGMKPAQRDDLLRQYRLQNSAEGALSGLLAPEDGKRRSAFFPVDAPQGMSIWDALTSGKASPAIPQGLIDLITGSARAVETPRAAAQGLIPDADIDMAALETAGLAMAGGGVVAGRQLMTQTKCYLKAGPTVKYLTQRASFKALMASCVLRLTTKTQN